MPALATWKGEIVARGQWPAYITERQQARILARLATPRDHHTRCALDTYLLAGLLRCGVCGEPMHVRSYRRHQEGGIRRCYLCASYSKHRGRGRCKAPPVHAHTVEAMLIASLPSLLATTASHNTGTDDTPGVEASGPRERLRAAVLAGDEQRVQAELEVAFATMQADAALLRGQAISQRLERELDQLAQLRGWVEQESHGRTNTTRSETLELNRLLRRWFTTITLTVTPDQVVIGAVRRMPSLPPAPAAHVRVDRAGWARRVRPHQRQLIHGFWGKPEIIGAMQAFHDHHNRSPTRAEWQHAGANHPQADTVDRHFRSWNDALKHAGLHTLPAPIDDAWSREEVLDALKAWTRAHGRPPTSTEWILRGPGHPCADTVLRKFKTWKHALDAVGLAAAPSPPRRNKRWPRKFVLDALRAWTGAHGRTPSVCDWIRAAPERPSAGTVINYFGSWNNALYAAGLAPGWRPVRPHRAWPDEQILLALQRWASENGRAPRAGDWRSAGPTWPQTTTVLTHFGSWAIALREAGLSPAREAYALV